MKNVCLVFLSMILFVQVSLAQKYLVIDRFGKNRIKLSEGDAIQFKQKNNPTYYKDVILALKDTSIILESTGMELPISEFGEFRFTNGLSLGLTGGTGFIGTGFLISAAVHPIVNDAQYDQKESAVIGATFLGIGALSTLFRWNKYKIGKRARVRIVDTTFKKMEGDSEENDAGEGKQ